jgi:hypothetical protein
MPEPTQIMFSFKEIAETLVKRQGLHDGIWGIFVKFGLGASNVGPNEDSMQPAAIIPIVEMGLQKFDKENNLSVDAAKVNPKPVTAKAKSRVQ